MQGKRKRASVASQSPRSTEITCPPELVIPALSIAKQETSVNRQAIPTTAHNKTSPTQPEQIQSVLLRESVRILERTFRQEGDRHDQ